MNTAFLSWPQARALALAGQLIRREAWTNWLKRRTGLWELLDPAFASLRIAQAGDFLSADAFASDWTTDLPETTRDVCARPQNHGSGTGTGLSETVAGERFSPPGIGLTGEVGTSTLTLHADLGASFPAGSFTISYFLDGVLVGSLPAAESGRYTLTTAFTVSESAARAWVAVRSSLPLPTWVGYAEWVFPAAQFIRISLVDEFPQDIPPSVAPGGFCGAKTFGPYTVDRYVYSHAADPAGADDDLYLNGEAINFTNRSHVLFGGATTLIMTLPAGTPLVVNVRNSDYWGGYCWAAGSLRLYNRPI
ncbi:MAG: hypothetical protein WCO94_14870 [Verrucomicrobiota bacterium]